MNFETGEKSIWTDEERDGLDRIGLSDDYLAM